MSPRYNSRHLMIWTPRWRSVALVAAALAVSMAAAAADWTQPAAQLARQVVAITGPGAASITYRNQSSLPSDQVDAIRRTLETQLRTVGIRLGPAADAAAEIRVTFSEDLQNYLWVAQVQQGSDTRVAMVAAERPAASTPAARPTSMTLRKTLLWSQSAQILDVTVLPAGSEPVMIVLDPAQVTLYKRTGSTWTQQQALGIPRDGPWPRDVRGRLFLARDHMFDAYLPGVICSSIASVSGLNCRSGDDPWPLANGQSAFFSPTRNFFTGVLTPAVGRQGSTAPFFSAAPLPRQRYTLWVFARTDGSIHALDAMNDISLRASGWGSDLATVNSGCGAGTQLLVTNPGDASAPDLVRVFELPDRDPVEAAAPVTFSGSVTALWASPDGHSAIAVIRSQRPERYDAFELAITCGQ